MEKVTLGRRMSFKWCIGALLTGLWMPLNAQMLPRLQGEVLAQVAPSVSASRIAARWDAAHPAWPLEEVALCSNMLHVWRFKLAAPNQHHDSDLLHWLNRLPEVQAAQFNLLLESRTTSILPNDSLFDEQWHLFNHGQTGGLSGADLGVDAAWNITTGGLTPHGDTVVVAVIDGGVGVAHPDLSPNLRVNWADVPGDLTDNDLNGYTDDHLGWNVHQKNDQIDMPPVQHGSQVSGVLAAKGNNAAGVSGVAWQLQMMFVAGTGTVASLLEAYDYVWSARKRYNDTNGEQGAFVVAVNCSWGINYGQSADAPLWCAAFDALGEEGILSVASVANNPVNIDSVGDLPGVCNSAYLTMVTSLDQHDNKAPSAAWGTQHVDLGAYGQSIRTTGGSGYSTASGTSMASPQVAGALGLLYSAPCSTLIRQAVADPAAAALWARHQVLSTTQPTVDLSGLVTSNGRLHAGHLLEMYEAGCVSCPMPFDLTVIPLLPNAMFLRWTSLPAYDSVEVLWRQVGALNWQTQKTSLDFLLLSGLVPCGGYELTLRALCAEGGWSDTTAAIVFLTDGCCAAPANVAVETQNPDFVQLHWPPVWAASGYRVEWKSEKGPWQNIETPDTSLILIGLPACSPYVFKIKTLCADSASVFSPEMAFVTAGCGPCMDVPYCLAGAADASDGWIAHAAIDGWQHSSAYGPGYESFAGIMADMPVLSPDNMYAVTITPGFVGNPAPHYFRIYIDFNADGDFEDADELAFDPGFGIDGQALGWIETPPVLASSVVRMRVMMKHKNTFNSPPEACEQFDFGQVEDYCVRLDPFVTLAHEQEEVRLLNISPNPAGSAGALMMMPSAGAPGLVRVFDLYGRMVYTQSSAALPERWHLPCGGWSSGMYRVTLVSEGLVWNGWLNRQ